MGVFGTNLTVFSKFGIISNKKVKKKGGGGKNWALLFLFSRLICSPVPSSSVRPQPTPRDPQDGPGDCWQWWQRERTGRERLAFWKDRGWRHDVEDYSRFFCTDLFVMSQWLQQTHGLLKFWRRDFFLPVPHVADAQWIFTKWTLWINEWTQEGSLSFPLQNQVEAGKMESTWWRATLFLSSLARKHQPTIAWLEES